MKRIQAIAVGIVLGGGVGYVAGIPLRIIIEIIRHGLDGLTDSKTIPLVASAVGAVIGTISGSVVSVDDTPNPPRDATND